MKILVTGAASRVAASGTAFPHRFDHYDYGATLETEDRADVEKGIQWSRACWAVEGEGKRLDLSAHYMERFDRGVLFMQRLTDVTQRDRVYQRQDVELTRRAKPPRVRLPSTYPRVL